MHELGLIMLLILICCLYCYAADTDMLLILICCWYYYAANIDTARVCMLYTTCSMFCAWPVYISLLYHAEIMQLLNHIPLKLNKSHFYQSLWKHSKQSFFIKLEQFQHDMFLNSKHSCIKRKQFQHDIFVIICII
jgi:hypothetical protein